MRKFPAQGKMLVYALALVGICINQASAALITNGSFETTDFTGWIATPFSGGTLGVSDSEGASDGTYAAVFNGGNLLGGDLKQSFSTIVGTEYLLDFDFGVFTNLSPGVGRNLQVNLFGAGPAPLLSTNLAATAASPVPFSHFSFNFTADNSSTTLRFVDFTSLADSLNVDSVLDNISVMTVVPVPGTMLLFGTGLIGLIGYNHRRKKVS